MSTSTLLFLNRWRPLLFSLLHISASLKNAALLAGLFLLSMCPGAYATDVLDITTGLKTLLLVNNRQAEDVRVAIVFDPTNSASKSDAETIKSNVDHGAGVPAGLTVTALLVSISNLSSLSQTQVAFLASGLSNADYSLVSSAASSHGVLTISTGTDCVKSNKCILGVITNPRLEIYYSEYAAKKANIKFSDAFIMLARKIE